MKRYKKTLLKANKINEAELCDCMPLTYELPNDYRLFAEEYHKHPGATWIVKPAGRSQGRGIFLFRKLKNLAEWRTKEFGMEPVEIPSETFIVQRYVENPYLLAGSCFPAIVVCAFGKPLSSRNFPVAEVDISTIPESRKVSR